MCEELEWIDQSPVFSVGFVEQNIVVAEERMLIGHSSPELVPDLRLEGPCLGLEEGSS